MGNYKVHSLADVQTSNIGDETYVWQYAVILKGAKIGNNCNINCHTFIENDVFVGNNVTVKSGVYLWDGITIEDNVFIGPNVTFTNDRYPRSKIYPSTFQRTIVKEFASIGANSTILGGVSIGSYALVGAGSLVTKSIPDFALVYGSPAKIIGWVDESGNKLLKENGLWVKADGTKYKVENNSLVSYQ
ncbi:acyltransferase [Lacibacter sp. H407]|uniref:acyltransferase n=1 Tax=Lacibacter sp. H407 TaxID=3133423 RepID=UPI0030C595BC